MEIKKTLLWVVFSVSGIMLFNNWQIAHGNKPLPFLAPPPQVTESTSQGAVKDGSGAAQLPNTAGLSQKQELVPSESAKFSADQGVISTARLENEVLDLEISAKGGTIIKSALKKHLDKGDKGDPVILMENKNGHIYIARNGLISQGLDVPNHNDIFTQKLSADGQTPLTGNLNVNNNNLTNVATIGSVTSNNSGTATTATLASTTINNSGTANTLNLVTTGTVTGGTGVVNYGSGQFYKDTSGNIGLGTTNPLYTLDIRTVSNGGLRVTDGTYSGTFVASSAGGMALTTGGAYPLFTYVNGAFRTAVNSQGQFTVGNSGVAIVSNTEPFIQAVNNFAGGQYIAGQSGSLFWNFGRDNVFTGYFIFGYNGTQVSNINSSTGVYTAVSDRRLKKNITPLRYGLKEVLALNPVMYNMKTEDDTKKKHIGLIAQEVKTIIDEAVEDIDETKQSYGLSATELVPVLIKAIQELNARIVVLEAKK